MEYEQREWEEWKERAKEDKREVIAVVYVRSKQSVAVGVDVRGKRQKRKEVIKFEIFTT